MQKMRKHIIIKLYNNLQSKENNMTQQQFNEILGRVHTLHYDFEEGISDEQAFDIAQFILDDNPGLEEFINQKIGASDAVGWLMCEM
jgi:hypothetical protein